MLSSVALAITLTSLMTTPMSSVASAAATELPVGLYSVTAASIPVRCGPTIEHYPFVHAHAGDTVRVVESMPGWARIAAEGPAFADAWGEIRYPADESGRFEVSGSKGITRGTTEVIAPNRDRTGWSDSFGWACTLPVDAEVFVLETTTAPATETGSDPYTVHRIRLPETATGWVVASALTPADEAGVSRFNNMVADPPPWMTTMPSSPIADWQAWSAARPAWIAAQNAPVPAVVEVVEVVEEVIPDPAPEPIEEVVVTPPPYTNDRMAALENTLAATPLFKLDAAAVAKLRAGYVAVVDEEATSHPDIAERAILRLRQLELAASINETRDEIAAAQARITRSGEDLRSQRRVLDESPDYVIRGELSVSPVFDGVGRPLYYRLQDPFSGRSLAYVSPESAVDVRGMLGQRVGIVGRMTWNPEWNVMTVDPERIDLVSVNPPR